MSVLEIKERILADAHAEAENIVSEAQTKAETLLAQASLRAQNLREETEREVAQKRKAVQEKREADARLESAKILLGEKRKVIDAVYDEALSKLLELSKEDTLRLAERLLTSFAEKGDEVVFAENFRYQEQVKILPIAKELGLSFAEKTKKLSGGMFLRGVSSDKDLTYGALLKADREENQSQLAREIFK